MAAKQAPKSLDEMLQADRKKRKAEQLAQSIFGRNRKQNVSDADRKELSPGASFASRVGINKAQRSPSSSSVTRTKQNGRSQFPSALSRPATVARLESAITGIEPANSPKPRATANGKSTGIHNGEISIRGAAGPYTVVAQNFAPGTTAADIESVVSSVGGEVQSCKLIASKPTVIAEMVFTERAGADRVVATFNNKKADGRLLYVYHKDFTGRAMDVEATGFVEVVREAAPTATVQVDVAAEESMEVDQAAAEPPEAAAYRDDRLRREEQARSARDDRDRSYRGQQYGRDERRDGRRAEPVYEDGRYGFGAAPQAPRWHEQRSNPWRSNGGGGGGGVGGSGGGRMYSDDMMRRSGPPRRW